MVVGKFPDQQLVLVSKFEINSSSIDSFSALYSDRHRSEMYSAMEEMGIAHSESLYCLHMPELPLLTKQVALDAGLSPVESQLARHILSGKSPKSFALFRSVSDLTVRKQLKSLLKKMHCSSQETLVVRLFNLQLSSGMDIASHDVASLEK